MYLNRIALDTVNTLLSICNRLIKMPTRLRRFLNLSPILQLGAVLAGYFFKVKSGSPPFTETRVSSHIAGGEEKSLGMEGQA